MMAAPRVRRLESDPDPFGRIEPAWDGAMFDLSNGHPFGRAFASLQSLNHAHRTVLQNSTRVGSHLTKKPHNYTFYWICLVYITYTLS